MARSDTFPIYRSDRSPELVLSLVTSILLHIILFLGANYWLKIKASEQKQSQEIPIEYVEVPPNQTSTPPPKTSLRAAKDSIAGGKVKPKMPVSTSKSASSVAHKASASSKPQNSPTSKPAEIFQPPKQPTPIARNPSPQKSQPIARKIAAAPSFTPPVPQPSPAVITPSFTPPVPQPSPAVITPSFTPPVPQPQQAVITPSFTPPVPQPQQAVITPSFTPPVPQPQQTVITPTTPRVFKPSKIPFTPTTPPVPQPTQTVVTPTTPRVFKPSKIPFTPTTTPPVPSTSQENQPRITTKSISEHLATRTTSQTPRRVQPSLKSGAASRLGGPINLPNRNFNGNYLASQPNSNRFNQANDEGIDASQDTGIGLYLQQLQQKVRQQWIPELTESSRRTVLQFIISRAGIVSDIRVLESSGFRVTDEAAINAVKRAAPFAPLPRQYKENNIPIEFTFNINVYGDLDLQRGGY